MPKFKINKLVRDKIIDHHIVSGSKTKFHILDEEQHKQQLINKIIEEAKEIVTAKPNEVASEIADVQQAIDDLTDIHGLSRDDVASAQKDKLLKNGGFKKGIFAETIEMDEKDKWVDYYRNNSDRYPEIK